MVNGVSLNSFLAAAQQNPDGNVRLSSDGTDVKATNSFFRKAVNWMSGNNHQTREVFAQALADEYGPDAAQFAFDQAGGGGFLSSSRGDQLSALEVNALNLYAQVKAQELSSPGQIPNAIPNMPNTPAANPQGANGNAPSMRRNQPSIARFSPPRGRDVDPPSVNSLQRGPTTRSHAPARDRAAIDTLEKISNSSDSIASFKHQEAELRKSLKAALGEFGCNQTMERLEAAANTNSTTPDAFKKLVDKETRNLKATRNNHELTSAAIDRYAAEGNVRTAEDQSKIAKQKNTDSVKIAESEQAIADAKKIAEDAKTAHIDVEKRIKDEPSGNGW